MMVDLEHIFLQMPAPLFRLTAGTGRAKPSFATIQYKPQIVAPFAHQQLKTILWIPAITELGNFFQDIRSDPAFILPDKLVPMSMFIEKNAFENVGFHMFNIPEKTKRMEPELHPEKL